MAKEILITFNQDGSLLQADSSAVGIRQGDSNGEVTLVATFQNRRNDAYVAKLHFERPDGKKQRNIVMTPSASQSNQFVYSFLSGWFFAVAGTAKVTVTITDSNGAVSAQGSYSFAVEPTEVDVVDSTITYDEAAELEGLIANSIKRAKTVTLGQNVGVAGFYAACLSYYGESEILDGDRFVGSTTNPQLNQSTKFFGEFVGDDKMLVIAKKRTYPTPASLTISHSVYVVSGGAQNPIVTEMVDSEKLSSLFDGTAAKKAVADQNGHVIDWTYATKAEVVAANNVGYIVIDDENDDENGNLTAAQVAEANKDVCFIQYTNSEGTMMLVSYYFGRTDRYFWSFMTNTLEIGEPDGSPWAYRFRQATIILRDIDDPTSATWQFNEDDDVNVTHEAEEGSVDLITSGGVYNAVSALESKISAVDDKVNYAIEAITKKDLYETQEATFQGMTAVPAGAMVKAYLDGFKGNSAVVNQLVRNGNFASTSNWYTLNGTFSVSGNVATFTQTDISAYTRLTQTLANTPISGHTYLLLFEVKHDYAESIAIQSVFGRDIEKTVSPNSWYSYEAVYVCNEANKYASISTKAGALSTTCNVRVRNVMLIDLTLAGLTSAEMADVATAKAALKHKGMDMDVDSYIPYNAGTLTDSKPTKLISYGYNLCDGEVEGGAYWGANGEKTSSQNAFRAANKFKCFGAVLSTIEWASSLGVSTIAIFYWDKNDVYINYYSKTVATNSLTFLPPSNCAKISFAFSKSDSGWGSNPPTKAEAQLCFHLASASLGYKPHVPAIEYDLTMPTLKSAGSVQDESKAGGSLVDTYNLGSGAWSKNGANEFYSTSLSSLIKKPASNSVKADILCQIYVTDGLDNVFNKTMDKSIGVYSSDGTLLVWDNSKAGMNPGEFKTSMTDIPLNYAKTTATDFTDPISYPEIIDVEAGGSVEVVGDGCDATTKVYFYVEA